MMTDRLTQQMLSLERINGKEPEFIETDIRAFIEDLATRIGPKILNAEVEFDVNIAPAALPVKIDQTLLGEAITNLIENALQHAGPTLTLIRLQVKQVGRSASISIENDGKILHSVKVGQLFERFVQGAESKGAGLGLSIVHEAVRLHHGEINVALEPTTCFEILLPIRVNNSD